MVNPALLFFMFIVSIDEYDIDLLNFEKLETLHYIQSPILIL